MTSKVAALQMASTHDVAKNVDMACELITQAASQGAELIVLPEEFATLGLNAQDKRRISETLYKGPIQERLQRCVSENKIWLVAGTLPLKDANEKPYSSTLVYNSDAECVARYDKLHLFDVVIGEHDEYRESDNVHPGNNIVVQDTPFGKLGLAICYDVRFPELFRALMLKGAQILLLPSAFTVQTGKAHWEVLVRARAIENLCYVIAPGECGFRSDLRPTYGHSLIVGPWGDILACAKEEPGVIVADIDLKLQQEIRQQFPTAKHIRNDVMQALVKEVSE